MCPEVDQAVESLYRTDWGRIVATLIRLVGDFEIAEEAAQEIILHLEREGFIGVNGAAA